MIGHCHVEYKQIDPEYSGKENYLKKLDLISLYSYATVQALPLGEISVCDDRGYTVSISSSRTCFNSLG